AYAWLDAHMAERAWAAGAELSLADCGAAPFLFYAHWTHPIDARHRHVDADLGRLMERPSYRRARDETQPYRHHFPVPGEAPDAPAEPGVSAAAATARSSSSGVFTRLGASRA